MYFLLLFILIWDGLSAAASGIAVISLAMQLTEFAREIQRLLREVADASKEVGRLVDMLEYRSDMLDGVRTTIGNKGLEEQEFDGSSVMLKGSQGCQE